MSLLRFPSPADARVASDLRHLCRDFQLPAEREQAVVGRFLRTIASGRSNGVAAMEARRVLHDGAAPCPRGAA